MPRGGFGRGFGRGFGMRRFGAPIVMPMGGMEMGGFGSPLLTTLMAGGLGYALGSNTAQQAVPQAPHIHSTHTNRIRTRRLRLHPHPHQRRRPVRIVVNWRSSSYLVSCTTLVP